MKRRHTKTRRYTPEQERQPGETWGQWLRRLYPKHCAEADRRLAREDLLFCWPRVARVKTEYHRRNR